jgi:glycosyltransferase involved in cell wall biosynthesis
MKIAIISSHPIQYNAPLFALLAMEPSFQLRVFYTWGEESIKPKYDPDFGKEIAWDIPLLEGYDYQFVENVSKKPGSHHFWGIDNPNLIHEIEIWGADVVWVWGWSFKSHLKVMRHFYGRVPVWFRGDSTIIDDNSPFWKKQLRRIFLSWVYKHIDLAFYVGENNKGYFKEYGVDTHSLIYAPHAVDVDRFSQWTNQNQIELSNWMISLGINEDNFVVLFVGKFEPKKNPHYILELASKLPSDQFKFVLVGDGVLRKGLVAKATQDSRILFLPFQNQSKMPAVYRLSDAFILPSTGPGETWGLAMNEAMACGIPVFGSSKCGGSIDLIDESCGLVFDPSDVDFVVSKLEFLAQNPRELVFLKEGAKRKAQDFRYDKIVDAVREGMNRIE